MFSSKNSTASTMSSLPLQCKIKADGLNETSVISQSSECAFPLFVRRSCEADEPDVWKPARLGLRFPGWRVLPCGNPASESQSDASGLDHDRATCPGEHELPDSKRLHSEAALSGGCCYGEPMVAKVGPPTDGAGPCARSSASQTWNVMFVEFRAQQVIKII